VGHPHPAVSRRSSGRVLVGAVHASGRSVTPIVFDAPRRARAFFEAVAADNLDIGRPDEIKLIFDRQIRTTTKGEFATKPLCW
jgi:hypothetical protein